MTILFDAACLFLVSPQTCRGTTIERPFETMDSPEDMNLLYISSSDSLRNRRIIQTIPTEWNDRPPLFMGRDQDKLLEGVRYILC
jgi:hypothetical protein